MSDKLQPCPFCGDVNPSMQGQTDRTLSYEPSAWVECETCGAQSRGFCRTSEAMEAWNRRTPSAPSAGEPVDRRTGVASKSLWDRRERRNLALPVTAQGDGLGLRERLAEFDFCIQKVAEALGAVCGGVDGDQKDVHATTAVLLRHIEKLKSQAVTGQGDANGGWLPIESAPKRRIVLVHYKNQLGNGRTMRACYYPPETLESEIEESGWADEGWYEESEAYEYLMPLEGDPTHWRPLPPAPVTEAKEG